jgi:GTP-binding protein
VLLHLVDGTADDVGARYRLVRNELDAYGSGLAAKPEIVVLNKLDALTPTQRERQQRALANAAGQAVSVVSAITGEGVAAVLRATLAVLRSQDVLAESAVLATPCGDEAGQ